MEPVERPALNFEELDDSGNPVNSLETDLTKRGFTGHEHIDNFELIHMNGRMYDFNNGRFLSVDPFIQGTTSQAINPYSYIQNNPLSGVDPSGYAACTAKTGVGDTCDVGDILNEDVDNIALADDGSYVVTTKDGNSFSGSVNNGNEGTALGNLQNNDISDTNSQGFLSKVGSAAAKFLTGSGSVAEATKKIQANCEAIHGAGGCGDNTLNPEYADQYSKLLETIPAEGAVAIAASKGVKLAGASSANTSNDILYSPLNKGPLIDDVAKTFRSSTYTEKVLRQDTTLYRVISDNGNPTGGYWTRIKPQGPFQSVLDSALDQNWGNTATRVVTARVPAGTKIYEGAAAQQRGLVGGGNQVYIPKVDGSWIQ